MGNKENSFQWEDLNPQLIFPIDFSSREIKKEFGCEPRGFREHVLKHSLFKDILLELSSPSNGEGRAQNSMPPIPLEAIPLLDNFYRLTKKKDYHSTFINYKSSLPENIEAFWIDLCIELYKWTVQQQGRKIYDLSTYCRHILFQNEKFTSALIAP